LVKPQTQVKELLAINIKALRKQCNFSQEKLAEVTSLSSQSISDIEGCRTWVGDKTLENLAKALNVDIYQLFIPVNEKNGNESDDFLYNRLIKLRKEMKEDIDHRLDQFFLSEKSIY